MELREILLIGLVFSAAIGLCVLLGIVGIGFGEPTWLEAR